jgi:heat shock protein HslJ
MSRRSFHHLAARVAVLSLCLAALTPALAPAPALAQDETAARRIERKWQLLEYRDANRDLQLVPPGIGVTALLFSNSIAGQAACSTYESSYTLAKENLFVEAPAVESRGCDAASQAIDDAFYQGLADTRTWSTTGSILTLRDEVGEVVMTLTRAQLPADPTLARWELARIGAADGSIEPVIVGVSPFIEFLRGGRIVGSTGCGSFLGSYTTRDSTIAISGVDSRLTDCTPALQQQAERIMATLAEVTDFEVLPAGLVLEDGAGTTRLALLPAIDLGRRTWTPIQVLDADGTVLFGSDRLNTSAVRFAGGVTDGRSICRGFKGNSLRSGLAISAFDLETLRGACGNARSGDVAPAQAVEDAFLAALEAASSHALRGDQLELMDVEGRPVMRLVPQSELVGPTWVVAQLDVTPNARKQRFKAPTGELPLTATFEDIGVIQGETGANAYIADYVTPGAAQIEISGADAFGRACSGRRAGQPLCKQEASFLSLLESADSFIVRPEDLRLFRGTRPIVRFVPAQLAAPEE